LLSFKLQIEKDYKAAVLAILDPLLMFASQTARAKRKGLADYGSLAQRHVESFEQKGVLRDPGPSEERLGAGDIQSLAELGNSYALAREMRAVPFGLKDISRLAAATAAPLFASITHNPQKNSLFASSSSCFEDPSRQPRQRIVSEQP